MKYLAAILFLLLTACSSKSSKKNNAISSANNKESGYTIDLDNAAEIDEIPYSTLFKAPKTIILETKSECLIERIRTIDIYHDSIYILDASANSLLVFNMDGKFLYQLGSVGNAPGEYTDVADFTINRKEGILYLLDEGTNRILKYDISSKNFLGHINIERSQHQHFCLQYVSGKLYMNETNKNREETNKYLLKEINIETGKQEKSYLSADEYNKGWSLALRFPYGFFYSRNTSSPKFVEKFMNTIVSVSEDGVLPAYSIKSKDFTTTEDIKKVIDSNDFIERRNNFRNFYNKNKVYDINQFIEFKNFVCFKYYKGDMWFYALYNKETGNTQVTRLFINDYIYEKNYFPMDIYCNNEKGIYTVLKSAFIPSFIDDIIDPGFLNSEIDQYEELKAIKEDANPIIFYHEYLP